MVLSNMRLTTLLGTDFWNDSCDPQELAEAVAEGAVGATSNPVIVHQAVLSGGHRWLDVLDDLIARNGRSTEDEIAWELITILGREAAEILRPVYDATQGRKGFLSMQVNPKYFNDARRMVDHARQLAAVAPNVAIKIPATAAGLEAIEQLTGEGIRINATVCFSVPQAVACAEAVERGLARRSSRSEPRMRQSTHAGSQAGSPEGEIESPSLSGNGSVPILPYVTIMVGRIDDHLRRVMEREEITVDPGCLNWAGVAVFKKAYAIFRERRFRSTLLAAAYRYHMHWTDLIGDGVIQTMPYKWWKQFNASIFTPKQSLLQPLAEPVLRALYEQFPDFQRAYDEGAMQPADFVHYGATIHTLQQFLGGYQKLVELVRGRMLV
jgi:transaldolase